MRRPGHSAAQSPSRPVAQSGSLLHHNDDVCVNQVAVEAYQHLVFAGLRIEAAVVAVLEQRLKPRITSASMGSSRLLSLEGSLI